MKNLILIGYKSSGKTHFGKLLSLELNCNFIDTDALVEKAFEIEYNEKLDSKNISLRIGVGGFRQIEQKVIHSLEPVKNTIIAVGGGALLNLKNCQKLHEIGHMVYLEVNKEIIKQRIFADGIPSFLDPNDTEGSFEKMYQERKPIYENNADFKITLQGKSEIDILNELKTLF